MTFFPFGETVTHLTRAAQGHDAEGNDLYVDTTTDIEGVGVAPRDANGTGGNEQVQGQDTVIVGLTLLLPANISVSATDRFIVRGVRYEVEGQPELPVSPFTGWAPGLPVALRRVTG